MNKPSEGGSYVRRPDGSLERIEATASAATESERRDASGPPTETAPASMNASPGSGKARTKEK